MYHFFRLENNGHCVFFLALTIFLSAEASYPEDDPLSTCFDVLEINDETVPVTTSLTGIYTKKTSDSTHRLYISLTDFNRVLIVDYFDDKKEKNATLVKEIRDGSVINGRKLNLKGVTDIHAVWQGEGEERLYISAPDALTVLDLDEHNKVSYFSSIDSSNYTDENRTFAPYSSYLLKRAFAEEILIIASGGVCPVSVFLVDEQGFELKGRLCEEDMDESWSISCEVGLPPCTKSYRVIARENIYDRFNFRAFGLYSESSIYYTAPDQFQLGGGVSARRPENICNRILIQLEGSEVIKYESGEGCEHQPFFFGGRPVRRDYLFSIIFSEDNPADLQAADSSQNGTIHDNSFGLGKSLDRTIHIYELDYRFSRSTNVPRKAHFAVLDLKGAPAPITASERLLPGGMIREMLINSGDTYTPQNQRSSAGMFSHLKIFPWSVLWSYLLLHKMN